LCHFESLGKQAKKFAKRPPIRRFTVDTDCFTGTAAQGNGEYQPSWLIFAIIIAKEISWERGGGAAGNAAPPERLAALSGAGGRTGRECSAHPGILRLCAGIWDSRPVPEGWTASGQTGGCAGPPGQSAASTSAGRQFPRRGPRFSLQMHCGKRNSSWDIPPGRTGCTFPAPHG